MISFSHKEGKKAVEVRDKNLSIIIDKESIFRAILLSVNMNYYPQPGGYNSYHYMVGDPYTTAPVAASTDWAGWIALFLVIILIIGAIIFFVHFNGATTLVQTRWNIIQGTTGNAETITGTGGTYYVVRSTSATLALTVTTPSTNPTGEEFVIDNSKTSPATVVTMTAGGTTFTIPAGQVSTFVWTTPTTVTLLSTSN